MTTPSTPASLARSGVERASNSEIKPTDTIVWNSSEWHAANRAVLDALKWTHDRQEAWLADQLGPPTARADLVFGSMPFADHFLLKWFGDRYRAHASRIAALHHVRYLAIQKFLTLHFDQLATEGWIESAGEHLVYDEALLGALVSLHYEPPTLDTMADFPPTLRYDQVASLATHILHGTVTVQQFERSPYSGLGTEVYEAEYESPALGDRLPQLLLHSAVAEWFRLQDLDDSALQAVSAGFLAHLPPEAHPLALQNSPHQHAILMWFLEELNGDTTRAVAYTNRVSAISAFLSAHLEDLQRDGFAVEHPGRGFDLDPMVLAALNLMQIEVRAGEEESQPFQYDSVLRLIPTLAALGTEARHSAGPGQPGRNDLCPCGSGRKYKKCCMQR